jgi:hypothetical protein
MVFGLDSRIRMYAPMMSLASLLAAAPSPSRGTAPI